MEFNDIVVERVDGYLQIMDTTTGEAVNLTAEEWTRIVQQYEDYVEPITVHKWKEGSAWA